MRIVAIIAAYNEELFIGPCLEHLFRHGIDAYLIDNCSQDSTVAIAQRYLDRGLVGIESFPRDKGVYHWESILARKEEVAEALDADWCIHADVDEFRLPTRPGLTLAAALQDVDRGGYNAVNFFEFCFIPTRQSPDHEHVDFQRTMRRYYPFEPRSNNQVRAWKKQDSRVDLASSAGHRVQFPRMRLYPEAFPMRHYLCLSINHLKRKYGDRIFDKIELRRGWHGWRSCIDPDLVTFPDESELRGYTSDDQLNPDEPRRTHIFEEQVRRQTGWLRHFYAIARRLSPG
jgi:glycosyltransferase involved in cell wall biosynthesis